VRAAVLEKPGSPLAVVDDVDIDDPRPGEVLVRVTHCGLCHSDVHMMDDSMPAATPMICGHEPAGLVEAVGAGVTDLGPGQKVVLSARPWCGRCTFCATGRVWLCQRATELLTGLREDMTTPLRWRGQPVFIGLGLAAFAELVVTKQTGVIPVADDTPLDLAAVLGCAMQTGVGAVMNTARVEPGASVLVMGLGGIGIAIAQGARLAGASRIIGVDPLASRREQALRFGVTDAVDAADDVVGTVRGLTDGLGVDYSFDAVGRAAIVESCLDATRNGGTVTMVGVGPLDEVVRVPLTMHTVSEKRLVGCLLGSSNSVREVPRLLDLWRAGRLDLEGMVTARRPLAEINEAIADMKAGTGLRTVLEIG
jgi:Zn-dependent alcohol dehydrogenase